MEIYASGFNTIRSSLIHACEDRTIGDSSSTEAEAEEAEWENNFPLGGFSTCHVAAVSEILSTRLKGENMKTENTEFTLT